MIEEIGEFFGKGILSILRLILWEFIAQIVFLNLGRIFLLILTLGRFPSENQSEEHENFIILVGSLIPFIAWAVIATFNNM